MSNPEGKDSLLDVLCELRREWAVGWYADPTPFDFRTWVQKQTAEFTDFELENPPATIEMSAQQVSVDGTPLCEFLAQADELAWRDGGVLIWVRQGGSAVYESDEGVQRISNQPRLQLVERCYLLESEIETHGGSNRVVGASFIEGDNLRVFTPDRMVLMTVDGTGRVLEEGRCPGVVPLVWYDLNHETFGEGDLPLLRVLRLGQAYANAWRRYQEDPDCDPSGTRLMQWQHALNSVDLEGLLARFYAVKERHWLSIQRIWCMHTGEEPAGSMHVLTREMMQLTDVIEEMEE